VAQVAYAPRARADLSRLLAFANEREPGLGEFARIQIEQAVLVLENHPLIGRPVEIGMLELVISRGRTGYVALYRFFEDEDFVLVLSVRHQREAGESGAQ
jgi:plasmid stabilization system protein ParE